MVIFVISASYLTRLAKKINIENFFLPPTPKKFGEFVLKSKFLIECQFILLILLSNFFILLNFFNNKFSLFFVVYHHAPKYVKTYKNAINRCKPVCMQDFFGGRLNPKICPKSPKFLHFGIGSWIQA